MQLGEMRRELIAYLRWSRDKRHSKTSAGHTAGMQTIRYRPVWGVAIRLVILLH